MRSFLISLKVLAFSSELTIITFPASLEILLNDLDCGIGAFLVSNDFGFSLPTRSTSFTSSLITFASLLAQQIPKPLLPLTLAPWVSFLRRESTARGKQHCRFGSLELDAFKLQSALCCYLAVFLIVFSALPGSLPVGAILDLFSLSMPPVPAVLSFPWHIIATYSIKKNVTLQFLYIFLTLLILSS